MPKNYEDLTPMLTDDLMIAGAPGTIYFGQNGWAMLSESDDGVTTMAAIRGRYLYIRHYNVELTKRTFKRYLNGFIKYVNEYKVPRGRTVTKLDPKTGRKPGRKSGRERVVRVVKKEETNG